MTIMQLIRTATACVFLAVVAAAAGTAQAPRPATAVAGDAWITTQIYARFFADPDIKGRNISVDTTGGVVTLTGDVHSAAEHDQAVAKAKGTDGVTRVVDKLTLRPGGPPATAAARDRVQAEWPKQKAQGKAAAARIGKEISDTWITTKVQSMYFLDREVKGMQVDVTTKGGVVTLAGQVDSDAARKKAIADAKSIEGVTQVIDRISVRK